MKQKWEEALCEAAARRLRFDHDDDCRGVCGNVRLCKCGAGVANEALDEIGNDLKVGIVLEDHGAPKRIVALKRALEPFAKEADEWMDSISNSYRPGVTEPRQKYAYGKARFSLGDCRRARRLLKETQEKKS